MDNTIKSTEFLPAHYTGHTRRDRTYHGGGVMICHKKELVIDEIDIIEEKPGETTHHDVIVWEKLTIRNASPIYIGSYYRPSSNFSSESVTFLKSSLNYIHTHILKHNTHAAVLLGGDFDVADIDWSDNPVVQGSSMSGLPETLLSTLSNYELSQLQHLPTYHDHVLDLFCSNKPSLVKFVSVIPGFSDHAFAVVDTGLKPLLSKKTPKKILKWSRVDWASIRQITMDFDKNTIQSGLGVKELYTSFMDHVKSLERFIPTTWSWVKTDVPWLTRT